MDIPKEVVLAVKKLHQKNFQAYAVGGCVRDTLLGRKPKDWDITTDATPKDIQKEFPKNFYNNEYGTVTVFVDDFKIEITTYRKEFGYADKRHPDEIEYAKTLNEDLERRDFTINAMAFDIADSADIKIVDLFGGQKDLKNKVIRAVGSPKERFQEDALRLMRAVRFASELGFAIEKETEKAIKEISDNLKFVSKERIRDEFSKIIMSKNAKFGVDLLKNLDLMRNIVPELLLGVNVGQNKHHIYDIYEHNTKALQYSADQGYGLEVRLASLLHDIAKPHTKRGDGYNSTFYNHDIVGAKVAKSIMRKLKFSNKEIDKVSLLVRYHLFYYNVGEVTESSIRRLIKNVGLENIDDLIKVRFADRIGSGTPKAEPYKLRHFQYLVNKVSKDPISVKMLKINGNDIMKLLNMAPGPKIGILLNAILSEVLNDPNKNNKEWLENRAKELNDFSVSELSAMVKNTEKQIELLEKEDRQSFHV